MKSKQQEIGKPIVVERSLSPLVFGTNATLVCQFKDVVVASNAELKNKQLVNIEEMSTITGEYHPNFDTRKKMLSNETSSATRSARVRKNIQTF